MLQNVAAHNIRVPKRKVFKTKTSHNAQRHKMYTVTVRHVTGNDQDYLRKIPEWLYRNLRFSKRATVGVLATYATR